MSLNTSLDSELIHLHQASQVCNELFSKITDQLLAKGIVEESYREALILRELNHPTAMQLETMGVAIPHVDVEHIREERLVVVTCPEGIVFNQFQAQAKLPREVVQQLKDEGMPVFTSMLPPSVLMKESHLKNLPLIHLATEHKLTQAYQSLFNEMEQKQS